MAEIVGDPNVDIDRKTGGVITGWPAVMQRVDDIFSVTFGELIMCEWYGSLVPRLLGENMTADTIVRFFSAIASALEQWEPCIRVTRITPTSVGRDGRFRCEIETEYRPRALLGDFTVEGARKMMVSGASGQVAVERSAA